MTKLSKRIMLCMPAVFVLSIAIAPAATADTNPQPAGAAHVYSGYSTGSSQRTTADSPVLNSVSARFTVPAVSCTPFSGSVGGVENMFTTDFSLLKTPGIWSNPFSTLVTQFAPHMSTWVGLIGGEGKGKTLIQTGVNAACVLGETSYGAFFEMPSMAAQTPPDAWTNPAVKAGDLMEAEVTREGAGPNFQLTLTDLTAGWTKQTTLQSSVTPRLALAVTESIPCNVPTFSPIQFSDVQANGRPFGAYPVQNWVIEPCQKVAPGSLNGTSFTVAQS